MNLNDFKLVCNSCHVQHLEVRFTPGDKEGRIYVDPCPHCNPGADPPDVQMFAHSGWFAGMVHQYDYSLPEGVIEFRSKVHGYKERFLIVEDDA